MNWVQRLKHLFQPDVGNRMDEQVHALRTDVDEIKSKVARLEKHSGLARGIDALVEGKGE